ncbi:MAG: cupin domain-containing protein [Pseudomonadota bacterium]
MQIESWGTMRWLVEDASHRGADLSLARMTVSPGCTSPAHRHSNANEAIHVVAGELEIRVGKQWLAARAGDTVYVAQGTTHQARCRGDAQAVLIIAYSAGQRTYESMEGVED